MKTLTQLRHYIQLAFLLLFTILGMFNLGRFWTILLLLTVIIGPIFCGWICPFGFIQDIMIRIREKLNIKTIKVPHSIHKYFKHLRFVLYGLSLTGLGILIVRLSVYEPYSITQTLVSYHTIGLLSFFSLLIFTSLSLFIDRFFCRYLCINGAQYSLASIGRFATINRSDSCVNCKKCEKTCPMNIKITSNTQINDPNCIRCHECIGVCPKKNTLSPRFSFTTKRVIVSMIVIFALLQLTRNAVYTASVDISQYPASAIVHTGTGSGYKGDIAISVIYDKDQMIDIVVTEHKDTRKYFDNALVLVPRILEKQSTDVDTIAGATYSSKGIIEAVDSAREKL